MSLLIKIKKKGMVFTLVSILISSLIISSFFFLYEQRLDNETTFVSLRVQTINNFIIQSESYVSNLARDSTKSALEDIINAMISDGEFTSDLEQVLFDCLATGSFSISSSFSCSGNSNLSGRLDDLSQLILSTFNIRSQIEIEDVEILQVSPWGLFIFVDYNITVGDDYGFWVSNKRAGAEVNIEGLPDPTSSIVHSDLSSLAHTTIFRIANRQEDDIGFWQEEPSTLHRVVSRGEYILNTNAPGFIQRLEGDMSASPFGLMSIVNSSIVGTYDEIASISGMGEIFYLDYLFWNMNCVPGNYLEYDFWKTGMSAIDRTNLRVNSSVSGLNGTRIPLSLAQQTNMDGSKYTYSGSTSC